MSTPLAYTISEACLSGRIGRTTLYGAIRAGDLRAVKLGRRTLILVVDLQRWISTLPAIEISGESLQREGPCHEHG